MGVFSAETLAGVTGNEGNTASDMAAAFRWKIGDPEPTGTFARASVALRELRNDMRRGRAMAEVYEQNYILINTFKPVGPQLEEVNR